MRAEDLNLLAVRDMLEEFKTNSELKVRSKMKYIKNFQRFITYLLTDIESPERTSNETIEERSAKAILIKDIDREIEYTYIQIEKKKGEDLALCKRRAEETLMTDTEMDIVLKNRSSALEDTLGHNYLNFDKAKITQIRNDLIVVPTIRLGRRSTELITMTCDEVQRAEERLINGEVHFIVKVLEQKDIKSGNEAPIAYNEPEYKVLKKYIEILRPKLNIHENCKSVFTTIHKKINNKLSLAGVGNVFQTFETDTGKKLGSRSIRKSKITNSRYMNLSDQQIKDRATSMSHTVSTAERYYNHKRLSDSVVSALSQSAIEPDMAEPTCSSTPRKKRKNSELDITIKTLRSKKIKKCH